VLANVNVARTLLLMKLFGANLAGEHRRDDKGDADKKDKDVVYEVSTQVTLFHRKRE